MGISLDQINNEVDDKYGPFVVEDVDGGDVVLRSPLRLPKAERAQLLAMNKELDAARKAEDVEALVAGAGKVVGLVSVGDGGKRLMKALGGDIGKIMYVLELYSEQVGLGEASRSDN